MHRLFTAFLLISVLSRRFLPRRLRRHEPATVAGVLAQIPHMTRGPGMYLEPLQVHPGRAHLPALGLDDRLGGARHQGTRTTSSSASGTASCSSSGVLGLVLVLAIPIYFIGLGLLLLAYFVPLLTYIYVRNQTVPDDQKVLTPYHLGEVANDILHKLGMKPMFNKDVGTVDRAGPPIMFVGKTPGVDQGRPVAGAPGRGIAVVHGRQGAGLRRRAAAGDRHPPGADHRAAFGALPDRRHPARRRAVRPAHRRRRGQCLQGALGDGHLREAQAARRLVRAPSFGPRPRFPRGDLGLEGRRKAGDANPRQQLGRDQDGRPGHAAQAGRAGPRPGNAAARHVPRAAARPGPANRPRSTPSLREIDRYQRNIITVEDPIEYHLDNVTQMEVNTKAGQTFATSLRSILRQDPDVIMIGEIRDQETASIACQAANTGHMVFSTVHSNDAVTALFRLLDLGVEPFMIASALSGVLGQRLVRVLCEACKEPYKPKPEFLKKANLPADKVDVFYRRPENPEQVCQQCGGTGYFGRTGIYELLVLTEPMRDMIRENPSINKIKAEARKKGMIYLQEDGLRQVIQGRTSIEELLRVVK